MLCGHQRADVVLDQMDRLPWKHRCQQGDDLLHEVGKRHIAQQRGEKEQKRKEGEEKSVRQLGGLPEAVIDPHLVDDTLDKCCHRHTTEKTALVVSVLAGSHGASPTPLLLRVTSGVSPPRPRAARRAG